MQIVSSRVCGVSSEHLEYWATLNCSGTHDQRGSGWGMWLWSQKNDECRLYELMDYLHQLTTKFIKISSEHEIHDVNRKQYNNTVDSDTSVCQWIIWFVTDKVNFKCKIYESKKAKKAFRLLIKQVYQEKITSDSIKNILSRLMIHN